MVVFCSLDLGPSASSAFMCRCGITLSKKSRNNIPIQKPVAAGTKDSFPSPSACSSAGTIRLHMEAATMTPLAKPVSALCTRPSSSFFIKKTMADPSTVPAKGISNPKMVFKFMSPPPLGQVQKAKSSAHPLVHQITKSLNSLYEYDKYQ